MPQMAPYNWLILFLLFNMILIFIMTINYYLLTPKISTKILKLNFNKFNLLW